MLLRYYGRILDTCEPYLIARAPVAEALERSPMGIDIAPDNVFDPQRVASGDFLHLVKVLDEMTYGPLGLEMPSWVFYDCAVMPGAIFGFARRAEELEPWIRRPLGVDPDYRGLVPMSLFIAIPTVEPGLWLGYSLASINQVAPGAAPEGLWRLTLAAGTAALGIERMRSTIQWRSSRLGLYAGLGPLEMVTAWTPAHDIHATVTFDVKTGEAARARLMRGDITGPEGIHRYLDADDHAAMRALQEEIEGGHHVAIVGPAEIRGAQTRVPLSVREAVPITGEDEAEAPGFTRRFQG